MTSKEMNSRGIYRLNHLKDKLGGMFEVCEINGGKFFRSQNGKYFRPTLFSKFEAIVLEYDDLEEGDLFYLNELTDEELLEAVIHEIEM